jgi:hypothetical protein
MKEQIITWLRDHKITDCKGLRNNGEYVDFVHGLFPNKPEEEIRKKCLIVVLLG